MTKVVAQTVLAPGHMYPFLSVLTELQRRGCSVILSVHTTEDSVPEQIAGVPVKAVPWQPPKRVSADHGRRTAERVWLDNLARTGEPLADSFDRLIKAERPEFLLTDPMLWGAMVAAEASGLPWATVSHNPLSIRGRGVDVRGPGLRPPHGPVSRFWHRVLDWRERLFLSRSLVLVNALRLKYGLVQLEDFRDRYLVPPLIIAATAPPFEYPRSDWPASLRFVGPLIWEPAGNPPEWLDRLEGRPLLLLAGSTVLEYRMPSTWIAKLFEGLADEAVYVVATLPTDVVPRVVPDNVVVAPFIPHSLLLPRAACVVCHGGYGITAKALAVGVPVLAIPLALDRFEVARRVEVAEAGVMLRERELTRNSVKNAVRQTIASRAGAKRIATAFRQAGGAPAAADAIEALLASEGAGSLPAGDQTDAAIAR